MVLERISILDFRNIAEADLAFSPNVNCMVGDNGTGKTNLLDAIYYLSMSKSAFGLADPMAVRHGADFFMLGGHYALGDRRETITCSYSRTAKGRTAGVKTLKRSGKEYDRLSEHVGLLPVVISSPSDTLLITEVAEERRRWLDSFLSQTDREYLNVIMRYNRLLQERNRLLKTGGMADVMEVIEMQMGDAAALVHRKRAEITERFAPLVADYYRLLSDDREKVGIRYRSKLEDKPFADLLAASRERDYMTGHTNVGPHRDDLEMTIGDSPIRRYGSQGQQKSLLLALKLAQFDLLREMRGGLKPILLLDDVFDKLDLGRVQQLIQMVSSERFGQIFITDSNKVRLEGLLPQLTEEYRLFEVRDGRFELTGREQPG